MALYATGAGSDYLSLTTSAETANRATPKLFLVAVIVMGVIVVLIAIAFAYVRPWSWIKYSGERHELIVDKNGFSIPTNREKNPEIQMRARTELMLIISQSKNTVGAPRLGVAITDNHPSALDYGNGDSASLLTKTVYSGALRFLPPVPATYYYVAVPGYSKGLFGKIVVT
jgi:hypothetical protein